MPLWENKLNLKQKIQENSNRKLLKIIKKTFLIKKQVVNIVKPHVSQLQPIAFILDFIHKSGDHVHTCIACFLSLKKIFYYLQAHLKCLLSTLFLSSDHRTRILPNFRSHSINSKCLHCFHVLTKNKNKEHYTQ